MSGNDKDNDNEFPYGKYPTNLNYLKNPMKTEMEKKENYYIVLHGVKI